MEAPEFASQWPNLTTSSTWLTSTVMDKSPRKNSDPLSLNTLTPTTSTQPRHKSKLSPPPPETRLVKTRPSPSQSSTLLPTMLPTTLPQLTALPELTLSEYNSFSATFVRILQWISN